MFSDFWEWVLIILVLVLVFGANNLSSWKALVLQKVDNLKKVATEKTSTLNKKNKDNKKE